MPGLFQKASLCVVQSVSVCANELLKKKRAHSLLEAVLRLKQPKREGGKYPQMSETVQGITWGEAGACRDHQKGLLGHQSWALAKQTIFTEAGRRGFFLFFLKVERELTLLEWAAPWMGVGLSLFLTRRWGDWEAFWKLLFPFQSHVKGETVQVLEFKPS